MSSDKTKLSGGSCPECDIGPFTRNHYFTGKLLVERDFNDEQRYLMDKFRHHHQRLHGEGVVCGLKVVQHDDEACRDRYLVIEPGTAVDCCGREIRINEREYVDITTFDDVKKLFENPDGEDHTLQVCIKYRECPTEEIPVIYDDCGCDETRCAPNRILESFELEIGVDEGIPVHGYPTENCCESFWSALEECPGCDEADCLVLATVVGFRPGDRMQDADLTSEADAGDAAKSLARIDNRKGRKLLPSTRKLAEVIRCLCEREPGDGGDGTPAPGIDDVEADFPECGPDGPADGSAEIVERGGERILKLTVPRGCDGEDGADGLDGAPGVDGKDGEDGVGLEKGLVRIGALSWHHRNGPDRDKRVRPAKISEMTDGNEITHYGFVIEFTGKVNSMTIDPHHVFQVLVPSYQENQQGIPLRCWCALSGDIKPVAVASRADGVITEAKVVPEQEVDAVAYILNEEHMQILEKYNYELWIKLRGDFVVDTHEDGPRAIDAEFVRGKLPTGDRPSGSDHGVQGGIFESWFVLGERHLWREKETFARKKININRATEQELSDSLSGVGKAIAGRIIKERKRKPIRNEDDLIAIDGITDKTIKDNRHLISYDRD